MNKKQKKMFTRILISKRMMVVLELLPDNGNPAFWLVHDPISGDRI